MLIIEGADLVGKTTLAKKLTSKLNDLGWPHVYQHLSRLPHEWRQDAVRNYARLCSPYTVRDRFHVSEPVYAEAREEEPMLNPLSYRNVDRIVQANGGYIIVITAAEDLIRERYARLGDRQEMYDLEKILAVNDAYYQLAHGGWRGFSASIDLRFHCHEAMSFVDENDVLLRAYTSRLEANYPYPNARTACSVVPA